MPKQLTTQNATITTAAVEVKTLTISGKQVTLAVFRQLREEPLIADDGSLLGTPWGYVNYHPDKCESSRWNHVHVVWQDGQDLVRARIDSIPEFAAGSRQQASQAEAGAEEYVCDEVDVVISWQVLLWLDGKRNDCPLAKVREWSNHAYVTGYRPGATIDSKRGFTLPAIASDAAVKAADLHDKSVAASAAWIEARDGKPDPFGPSVAECERKAREADEALELATRTLREEVELYGRDAQTITERLIVEEAARRKRHYSARAQLAALPQLFIAV